MSARCHHKAAAHVHICKHTTGIQTCRYIHSARTKNEVKQCLTSLIKSAIKKQAHCFLPPGHITPS